MIKKPHFYYTRLEKIALTLTHKIPFLPILDHFLSHLNTTTLNPRPFPIYRCNNPKKFKKLSQGSGPQCHPFTYIDTLLHFQLVTYLLGIYFDSIVRKVVSNVINERVEYRFVLKRLLFFLLSVAPLQSSTLFK